MRTEIKVEDRRAKRRFPIQRELHYKLLENHTIVANGTGATIDMGSGGVAFAAGRHLTPGAFVELSISWPALLDGNTPVRLVVYGQVSRSSHGMAACSIHKYEFRTQAKVVEARPATRNDSIFQRWVDEHRRETLKARASA